MIALILALTVAPPIAGNYRWVGGDAETRALDQAIEGVVKQANIFIRGIMRRRLRAPNLPAPELQISVDETAIVIRRPGRPEVSAPADGRAIDWRHPDGDHFTVSHRLHDGILEQHFEDRRSQTLNRFLLSDDRHLVVETTIRSKYLPIPLQFRMTYERR